MRVRLRRLGLCFREQDLPPSCSGFCGEAGIYNLFGNISNILLYISGEFMHCEALQVPSLTPWLHKCPSIFPLSSGRSASPSIHTALSGYLGFLLY